jgi:hypothetical protein
MESARHGPFASVAAVATDRNGNTMGDRLPSFVQSPSLVNLGGLAVSDQPNIVGLHTYNATSPVVVYEQPQHHPVSMVEVDVNSGWGGMGLRGNRSSGNLQRSTSDGSGLFIDEEEQQQQQATLQQDAGERSATEKPKRKISFGSIRDGRVRQNSESSLGSYGYVKTTSMARFYYRNWNTQSLDGLASDRFESTASDPHMDGANEGGVARPRAMQKHHRQKSKSHSELSSRTWGLGGAIQE